MQHVPHSLSHPSSQLLLTLAETAEVLALSERYIWQLAVSGEIPSCRIGRSSRFSQAALEARIESKSRLSIMEA